MTASDSEQPRPGADGPAVAGATIGQGGVPRRDPRRCRRAGARRAAGLALAAGAGLLGAQLAGDAGWRINLSPSAAIGLYRAESPAGRAGTLLRRGSLVAACLPPTLASWGRRRRYLGRGSCGDGSAPVGKTIFALPGDTVSVGPAGLACNGALAPNTRALARDRHGRQLPRIRAGRYVVPTGQVWLVSTRHPGSWDSRYYGPVPIAAIVGALHRVWASAPP